MVLRCTATVNVTDPAFLNVKVIWIVAAELSGWFSPLSRITGFELSPPTVVIPPAGTAMSVTALLTGLAEVDAAEADAVEADAVGAAEAPADVESDADPELEAGVLTDGVLREFDEDADGLGVLGAVVTGGGVTFAAARFG